MTLNKAWVNKALIVLKTLLMGGGPIAIALGIFFHFGSDDADKIVVALGSIASFAGGVLLLGPSILTDNQMTTLGKSLLTSGGAVSVILTRAFNMDSALVQHILEVMGALTSVGGLVWMVASSSDKSVLLQATKVEGVDSVRVDPTTSNPIAQNLAASQSTNATKVQFTPTLEQVVNQLQEAGVVEPTPPPPTSRTYSEL